MSTPDTFRLLHFSDSHRGRQFREELWDHFVSKALTLRPHVILITGDCVDTPWRWTLDAAKRDIDKLEQAINEGRQPHERCQIRVTPGNHDVRLTGLIPVRPWLTIPLATGLLLFLLLLAWSWNLLAITHVLGIAASVASLLTILHASCIGHFATVFHDRLKAKPERFTAHNIHVDLYHFDSATTPIWFAEGLVRTKDFLTAVTQLQIHPPMTRPDDADDKTAHPAQREDTVLSYPLAITHHHALGIPYDHQHEPHMIMRNSGAFLAELAQKNIRLVLHGHKHHQHFSRLTVNAEKPDQFEIGVLGAGTLTRGKETPERYGYHFYYLELDSNLNMKAQPYLSTDGGPFKEQDAFYIEDSKEAIRRQRQFAQNTYGLTAGTLKVTAVIYSDGDTLERVEHHAFRVTDPKKSYATLPNLSRASVDRGHIEGFMAGPLDDHCPPAIHLDPDPQQFKLRQQFGRVMFGSTIYHTNTPFSFYTEFSALNSFSMSVQQHEQRYGHDPQPRVEETTITTPLWPIDKLDLVIRFPKEFHFIGLPDLAVHNPENARLNLIEEEYRSALFFEHETNTVRLGIPHPPPNTQFVIRWRLPRLQPPSARAIASLSGATRQLQHSLIHHVWNQQRSAINPNTATFFQRVGEGIGRMVAAQLSINDPTDDPLEISVMVYDDDTNHLRIVAASYSSTDTRTAITLEFGDGVGGRAYKNNAPRLFIKAEGLSTNKPLGYLPWITFPDAHGIPHEVLLCIPLTNPENADLIYGVLNIGSTRADSQLLQFAARHGEPPADTEQREKTYKFMDLACWQFLNANVRAIP